MSGGINFSQIRTNGTLTPREVLNQALDNFGEEQGYGATPYPGAPYVYTNKIVSQVEALNIMGGLTINDERSPLIATTSDYDIVTEKVVKKVSKRDFEEIRKNAFYSYSPTYLHLFPGEGYVKAEVEVADLPEAADPHVVLTPGDFEDVYVIMSEKYTVVSEHDTLDEATVEATRLLNKPENVRFSKLDIEIVRRRKNGTSLAAVVERNVGEEVEVTFTVSKNIVKPGAKVNGYVIGYYFHS